MWLVVYGMCDFGELIAGMITKSTTTDMFWNT